MRATLLAVLATLAGPACKKEHAPPTPPRDAPVDARPAGHGLARATCTTADDCRLSLYKSDTDCCGNLCGYLTAYQEDELTELLARRDDRCREDFTCKDADCPDIDHDQLPGCQAGVCVVAEVPEETPCTADTDCVLTAAPRGACCGPKCGVPMTAAVHQADAAALDAWRTANCDVDQCPTAKCTKPDFRTEARCASGRCVAQRLPQ